MDRVVILGGGYAGLHAFAGLQARLRRQIASGEVQATLVSRDPYHTYHGWTGEVLSGRLPVESTLTEIAGLVGEHFVQGEVTSLDYEAKTIRVSSATGEEAELSFDHLVFATGSTDPFDRLPGLAEHGWCLKNTRDMQRFADFLDSKRAEPQSIRNVVVVGGGLAGIEAASALAQRFTDGDSPVEVHVVSSRDRLLDELRPDFDHIADHATSLLRAQGVHVHYGRRVTRIADYRVEFAPGESLSSDLTIAAAGLAFDNLPGSDCLPRTAAGQVMTEATLQVRDHPGVWAAGDIAAVKHPGRDEACPTNALWAMKQGDCVGENIARAIKRQKPKPFGFKGMGQAAGLAGRTGITELYRMQFTGRFAWLVRILFFAWYMPSRRQGFSIVWNLLANAGTRPVPALAGSSEGETAGVRESLPGALSIKGLRP